MALTAGNLKAGACVSACVRVCRYFLSIIQRLTALTSSHYLADEIEYHLHSDTGNDTTTVGAEPPFHAAVNRKILVKTCCQKPAKADISVCFASDFCKQGEKIITEQTTSHISMIWCLEKHCIWRGFFILFFKIMLW